MTTTDIARAPSQPAYDPQAYINKFLTELASGTPEQARGFAWFNKEERWGWLVRKDGCWGFDGFLHVRELHGLELVKNLSSWSYASDSPPGVAVIETVTLKGSE